MKVAGGKTMDDKISGLSRRGALMAIGAGAMGLAGGGLARAELPRPIMGTWPVGVQLWSVNAELHRDVPGTLRQLKSSGYDVVETAGLAGLTAPAFRKVLDDNGLVCPSAHVAMGDLLSKLDEKIAEAHVLGCQYLVCASPKPPSSFTMSGDWVSAIKRAMTLDAWKANADDLAQIAPRVTKAGLKFAYHNHFMEFADHGGVTGYDLITRALDPEQLRLEIDLGWVLVGGGDPLDVLVRHADRVDMLHIKDFVRDPSQPLGWRSVDVGQGLIDWRPVLTAARKQGVKYLFVEQEAPYAKPVLDSLAAARTFLTKGWASE
jgi:sugar phosphate isomerase/epimerase